METLGKEALILFLEKEKLASEKELETVTGRRLDEWSQQEEILEEKTKELKKKLARVFSSFKRIHQDEIPNCRVCSVELIPGFNWNVGDRRYHRYICTRCRFLENQERYRRKKGEIEND